MEELLKRILAELDSIKSNMAAKQDIIHLEERLLSFHAENIQADEKLLEAVRTTNERLDFHREKVSRVEEELYLIKQKQ